MVWTQRYQYSGSPPYGRPVNTAISVLRLLYSPRTKAQSVPFVFKDPLQCGEIVNSARFSWPLVTGLKRLHCSLYIAMVRVRVGPKELLLVSDAWTTFRVNWIVPFVDSAISLIRWNWLVSLAVCIVCQTRLKFACSDSSVGHISPLNYMSKWTLS